MAATRGLPLTRDHSFYYSTVVIQVENTLFNVPREGLLEPGSHFETLFHRPDSRLPAAFGIFLAKPEGMSDSNPFVVKGVSKKLFKAFLRFLYPMNSRHESSGKYSINPEEMFEVLELVSQWNMKKLRAQVVAALSIYVNSASYVNQLSWGYTYQVASWFRQGALALVTRSVIISNNPSPHNALLQLGLRTETVLKLLETREQYLSMRITYIHPKFENSIPSDSSPCAECKRVVHSTGSLDEVMKTQIDMVFAVEMSGGERDRLNMGLSYCNRCCPVG